ncbi:MAG: TM2 domain-containing protein [Elusimicrobiota bacterium]|jgi:TM2 domain-containing membrane protein YozV|nr:TM2 domain-containing protein [Elusimicrobiota bacterium]
MAAKSKVVAGLLAIFVGYLGIHEFYLEKPVAGALYLVGMFFTLICLVLIFPIGLVFLFIICLVSFIQGIVYLCTSDTSFETKYHSK